MLAGVNITCSCIFYYHYFGPPCTYIYPFEINNIISHHQNSPTRNKIKDSCLVMFQHLFLLFDSVYLNKREFWNKFKQIGLLRIHKKCTGASGFFWKEYIAILYFYPRNEKRIFYGAKSNIEPAVYTEHSKRAYWR